MKILGCICLLLGLWMIVGDFVGELSGSPPNDAFWFVRPLKDGLPTLLFGVLFLILGRPQTLLGNTGKGAT